MAKRLQLEIQGTTNFAFDVEGEWYPSMQPEYKTAANPPELTQIREVWEFRACRIVPSDGTTETLWDDYLAFRARLQDRSNHPTYLKLVRDPAGSAVDELVLGPGGGYEQLQIEVVDGEEDPQAPDASWAATATVTIRASAVKKFADANGIVGWEQDVDVNYSPAGLRTLRWTTRITTAEGTNAVDKAKTYAVIPVSALGGDHTYSTNSTDGIDYVYSDADEQNSRTPTQVVAVSEITEWGVGITVTAAGQSPGFLDYSETTRITKDETVTTIFAAAQGPNAQSWVASKAPSSDFERETVDRQAVNFYATTWIRREPRNVGDAAVRDRIEVTISGGHRAQRLRAVTGGYQPRRSEGGLLWWEATVTVQARKTGSQEIDLPGLPGAPWVLDYARSSESEPLVEGDAGPTEAQTRYVRQATLVLTSTEEPQGLVSEAMRDATRVKSYYLP